MGKMFVSYRRADSGVVCGRLTDSLRGVFGADSVFRDVSNIPGGVDFRSSVNDALSQSQVVIALIGPSWATVTDEAGRRRLDNPDDPVRVEIESALQRRVPILPVLVLGAHMPPAQVLPPAIAQLSFLNAYELHDDPLYQTEIQRLIQGIAYFIPLLPTDQSRLQQQANVAFVEVQRGVKQVAPIVKTVWTGGVIALFVFSVIFAISGCGMFFVAQSFGSFVASSLSGAGAGGDPAAQGFEGYANSIIVLMQLMSIGFAVLGVVLAVVAVVLLRRSMRRRAAAAA